MLGATVIRILHLLSLQWSLIGCTSAPSPSTENTTSNPIVEQSSTTPSTPATNAVQPVFAQHKRGDSTQNPKSQNLDQGQQHPPLPADNPAWEWDAQSFVPDFGWYGEHNWADVRMRVVGHLAMGYRDLARFQLLEQNWDTALKTLQTMQDTLDSIDTSSSSHAEDIKQLLRHSTSRDIQIIQALQGNGDFPQTDPNTLIHWRIEYWKLAIQAPSSDGSRLEALEALQQELTDRFSTPTVSKIDDFKDFTDRHKLRKELFEAYVNTLDPLLPSDLRWGYWRPSEIQRQAGALWMAAETLKQTYDNPHPSNLPTSLGRDWWIEQKPTSEFHRRLEGLHTENSVFAPSVFSHRIRDQRLDLSAEQLGRLPTGDSIIDVGGQPGPMGIGTLMKLDASDPDHRVWLESYSAKLQSSIEANPETALKVCSEAIQELDTYTHGSRFYNVKQFRNACTRQFARLEHYSQALKLFEKSFPLHHQDWACPNREGLLLVILGRLHVLSGNNETGLTVLQQSIDAGLEFLNKVTQAENGELTTPKPPMMQLKGGPIPNSHASHAPKHPPNAPSIRQQGQPRGATPPNHSPHTAGSAPAK